MGKPPGGSKDLLPSACAQPKAAYCPESNGDPAEGLLLAGPTPFHPGMDYFKSSWGLMSSRSDCLRTEAFTVWLHFLPLGLGSLGSPGKAPVQIDRFPGRESQASEHWTGIWDAGCLALLLVGCRRTWCPVLTAQIFAGLIGGGLRPLLVPPFTCPGFLFPSCW